MQLILSILDLTVFVFFMVDSFHFGDLGLSYRPVFGTSARTTMDKKSH